MKINREYLFNLLTLPEKVDCVKKDCSLLEYIDNDSVIYSSISIPKLILEDPLNLQYIRKEKQDLQLCIDAVKQNPSALQFAHFQTEEMCLEAVKNDGLVLQFIKEQTEQICLSAIESNPWSFKFIRNKKNEYYDKLRTVDEMVYIMYLVARYKYIENEMMKEIVDNYGETSKKTAQEFLYNEIDK